MIFDERHDKPVPTCSVEDKIRRMKFTDFLNGINQLTVTVHSELLTGSYYASFFLLAPLQKMHSMHMPKTLLHHLGINPLSTASSGYQSLEYFIIWVSIP